MPDVDGLEAARRIRESASEGCGPRLVALTAHALEGDRASCLSAGMDDYISKPILLGRLKDVLRRAYEATRTMRTGAADEGETDDARIDKQVWDDLRSLQMDGEPNLLKDVLNAYLDDAPERIDEMTSGLAKLDREAVREAAHSLKGSSANVGAVRMFRLCADLERAVVAGDMVGVERRMGAIREEFDRLRNLFREAA